MDDTQDPNMPETRQSPPDNVHPMKPRKFTHASDMLLHLPDISDSLQAPRLPHADPDAISLEQVTAGVTVLIPGSPMMRREDIIVFYWGQHECFKPLHYLSGHNGIAWLFCMAYPLIDNPQYGWLDLYYEVYRADQLIGTSPSLPITVQAPQ